MVEGNTTNWVNQRVTDILAQQNAPTVAIVVTKEEVKSGGLHVLGHLTRSKEFRQDLNLTNAYWFYHQDSLKRCLVV